MQNEDEQSPVNPSKKLSFVANGILLAIVIILSVLLYRSSQGENADSPLTKQSPSNLNFSLSLPMSVTNSAISSAVVSLQIETVIKTVEQKSTTIQITTTRPEKNLQTIVLDKSTIVFNQTKDGRVINTNQLALKAGQHVTLTNSYNMKKKVWSVPVIYIRDETQ